MSLSPANSPHCNIWIWISAIKHCTAGLGIWEWASNDEGCEPDVVMACAGDVPTLETLAAVEILRKHFPRPEDPRRQRGKPDEAAAAQRAPGWLERQGI